MTLTPLHSLRLVVGECDVVERRSFRGTWEPTPPDPTGLDVGAASQGRARTCLTGCADLLVRIRRRRNPGQDLQVGAETYGRARTCLTGCANCPGLAESLYPLRLPWTSL